jgi:hypothetical protein
MKTFQPGNAGGPGRPRGARNKLASKFLAALAEDFEAHGADAIKIARMRDPIRYVAIIASLMPKELTVEHSQIGELSDEEISALLAYVRELRAKLIEPNPNPEPVMITNGQAAY